MYTIIAMIRASLGAMSNIEFRPVWESNTEKLRNSTNQGRFLEIQPNNHLTLGL